MEFTERTTIRDVHEAEGSSVPVMRRYLLGTATPQEEHFCEQKLNGVSLARESFRLLSEKLDRLMKAPAPENGF